MARAVVRGLLAAALVLLASIVHADPQADFSRGLLWRVELPGIEPSHIFGTIHLADERVTQLPGSVREALNASRSFTMEILLDDMARLAFADALFLDGERNLPDLVGQETFAQAAARMRAAGIPPEVTARLKPWAVLINLVAPEDAGGVILDNELFHQAMLQRKPVYQLETVDEQIALFDDIPMEAQVALLQDTVRRFDEVSELTAKIIEAYLAGDLGEIWRINAVLMTGAGTARPYYEQFIERVIYGRSVIMAHRMQARLREGNAFIAVGALHLYGEHGVLNLLRREGFRVTRVY
jgi:uncharacterized protein